MSCATGLVDFCKILDAADWMNCIVLVVGTLTAMDNVYMYCVSKT